MKHNILKLYHIHLSEFYIIFRLKIIRHNDDFKYNKSNQGVDSKRDTTLNLIFLLSNLITDTNVFT